jgi:CubicO group peptidase (beta-lactamase class C family)
MPSEHTTLGRRGLLTALGGAGIAGLTGASSATGRTADAGIGQTQSIAAGTEAEPTVVPEGTERIERTFEYHQELGLQHGSQLAAYRDGEPIVNLAGGVDGPDGDAVAPDTRFLLFSCTKPYAAACLHVLADRNEIDFDDRVVEYWPEYADPGAPKAETTIRHVLSHQAGIPAVDVDDEPERWDDPHAIDCAVEDAELAFEPGETAQYHVFSFGWIIAGLIRRIDGRRIDRFAREEVFGPLGMDRTHIGLPADEPDDVATLVGFEPFDRVGESDLIVGYTTAEAAAEFNQEFVRRSVVPGATGVGTAGDLARFYACYANNGELEGTRLLDKETVQEATSVQVEVEPDGIATAQRYGLGFQLGGALPDRHGVPDPAPTYGHAGLGSSISWTDPDEHLAFAYVTNGIRDAYEHDVRMATMGETVRRESR